jgi:hypothetical protein
MFTLVAVLCHVVSGVPLCSDEIITESIYENAAGRVGDPVEIHSVPPECAFKAKETIAAWIGEHPVYKSWDLRGWKCFPNKSKGA